MYKHDTNKIHTTKQHSKFIKPSPEQITAWMQSNFECKSRKGGIELCINSPFDGDTGHNFNVGIEDGLCHDWRGNDRWTKGGKPTFLLFVQLYRGCTFQQAIKEVCGGDLTLKTLEWQMRQESTAKAIEKAEKIQNEMKLPSGSQPIIGSNCPKMASILIKWLNYRGVDEEHIKLYNIHHRGDDVIWPYYEYDTLVYWQSRNRLNKIYRFPNESVGVTKGMFLYGFDMVKPGDYCAVAEAIFGAHTIDAQCLASGGACLTNMQIKKLRVLNPIRGVILAPDNDKAGILSIIHNYELIKPYFKVFSSIPPKIQYIEDGIKKYTKDYNELITAIHMGRNEVREIFEKNIKLVTPTDLMIYSTTTTF